MARPVVRSVLFSVVLGCLLHFAVLAAVVLRSDTTTWTTDVPLPPGAFRVPGMLVSAYPHRMNETERTGLPAGVRVRECTISAEPIVGEPGWNEGPFRLVLGEYRFGWPAASLSYYSVGGQGGVKEERLASLRSAHERLGYRAGYDLTPHLSRASRPVVLPLAPTLGLPFNLLLYCGVVYLIVEGAALARRRRRRRRNQCAGCGYQVAGLASCPECGRAVEQAITS